MMSRLHTYDIVTTWTGNRGVGTASYRAYEREHQLWAAGKPAIEGSADPAFRGDPTRWNPEEMFVASVSSCHMLWYLHLCAEAGIVVTGYTDDARGEMQEDAAGSGRFTRIELRPRVALAAATESERALALHAVAHAKCFIARSVRCDIEVRPKVAGQP
ncbi:MAG: OsmC family protein [Rhodospirillales bacterium]|nr:OsmC family protein [Rhodospirillales bacterium]